MNLELHLQQQHVHTSAAFSSALSPLSSSKTTTQSFFITQPGAPSQLLCLVHPFFGGD
jgi:hypothetical protein